MPDDLDARHALDAPFAPIDDWADTLTPGLCTACGQDAWAGQTGWWHEDHQRCPDTGPRTPGFAPDA